MTIQDAKALITLCIDEGMKQGVLKKGEPEELFNYLDKYFTNIGMKLSFSFITDCGDATSIYDVKINDNITIKELISYVLSDKKEWGYIIIDDKRKFEYRYGKVISNKFTKEELNYVIKNMIWSGGWTRSDYIIFKDKRKPKFDKKH